MVNRELFVRSLGVMRFSLQQLSGGLLSAPKQLGVTALAGPFAGYPALPGRQKRTYKTTRKLPPHLSS
jgi:hypothetical protein